MSSCIHMVKAATVEPSQVEAIPKMTKGDWKEIVRLCLDKLAVVRRHLITRAPLVASCVMKMAVRISYRTKTMATDGRYLIVNPDFLDGLDIPTAAFVIAHEALHCALGHVTRRGERERKLWNVAVDYVVNNLLKQAGMDVPKWVLQRDTYFGKSAEEVYAALHKARETQKEKYDYDPTPDKDEEDQTADHDSWGEDEEVWPYEKEEQDSAGEGPDGDEGGADSYAGQDDESSEPGPSPSEDEEDEDSEDFDCDEDRDGEEAAPWDHEEEGDGVGQAIADRGQDPTGKWRQAMSEAVEEARASGHLTAELESALEDMTPIVDWRQELAAYLSRKAGEKKRTDWGKMKKVRMGRGGRYFVPRSKRMGVKVGVIADVSGSVSTDQRSQFVSELGRIVGTIKGSAMDLLLVTDKIEGEPYRNVKRVEDLPVDALASMSGMTEFSVAFEWFATLPKRERPDVIVVLTDGYVSVGYDKPRGMEVVWCVTVPGGYDGWSAKPWGKTLKLDPHA